MSVSSKDVFALRKQGELGQAFAIAEQLIAENPADEWNQRAYAWCAIDLIKQALAVNDHDAVAAYFTALENVTTPNDEILQKSLNSVRALTSPAAPFIKEAKQASEANDHNKANNLLKQALQLTPADISLRTNLGWVLYKQAKMLLQATPVNVFAIKRLLNDYLQLNTEKPSLLHSSMLRIADGLSQEASFDLPAFIIIWGLGNFQPDDFLPYVQPDTGNKFSSLAEKVITHAVKQAVEKENRHFLTQALPLLDEVIRKSEDPIWLILNKAKALILLGKFDESFKFTVEVAKRKMGDYWIWELLGDIKAAQQSEEVMLFYGKALSIKAPEQYLTKLRIKLCKLFLNRENYAAAKCELERIQAYVIEAAKNLPQEAIQLMQQPWYQETTALPSNQPFYQYAASKAEQVLYSALPYYFGVVAESFALKDKPHKKKYRLYLKLPNKRDPVITVVAEQKLKAHNLTLGDAIMVKGESQPDGKFNVLVVAAADAEKAADLVKNFNESCVVSESGLGFTSSSIFIDSAKVKQYNIQNNAIVAGVAIRSFDKKKERWGWKAFRIDNVQV